MCEPKNPCAIGINRCFSTLGAVVEDVRTVFERLNDTTIYIPKVGWAALPERKG